MTEIAIGIAITLTVYCILDTIRLAQINKRKKRITKKANEDMNIEFGGNGSSGIELVKKEYPDLKVVDNHRESSDYKEPHSIAKGMNDPSDMQTKAFEANEKCQD